jgi:exosortase
MIFIPVVAVLAACWHSFKALHLLWVDWTDSTRTVGCLVTSISIWLLWRERKIYRELVDPISIQRIFPLSVVMSLWLLAMLAGIQAIELLLVPLVLWVAIGAGLGWPAARRAMFPLAFAYFAIPNWTVFNDLFQWSSVYAVRAVLRLVGVPAYFDENRVHIPEGTFEIAEGCSGLNFAVVGAAMAVLLGELRRDGLTGRIKLLMLAVGLAMLANWVRIIIIVEAGHLTNMQHYLVARSHYGFGWIVFVLCMAAFYWLEWRMPVAQVPVTIGSIAPPKQFKFKSAWRDVTLAIVPVLGFFTCWLVLAVRPAMGELAVPPPSGSWTIQSFASDNWQPNLAGVDEYRELQYRRADGATVDAYFGLYRYQSQGKEFSAYGNDLHPGADLVGQYAQSIAGTPFVLRHYQSKAGGEELVAASYRVGHESFAQPAKAQL